MSINTIDINRRMTLFADRDEVWLFGYGSLIFKADFAFLERRHAAIRGWSRRLWQGSHDHRGTPAAPGRVATLMGDDDAICVGVAYLITRDVFAHLDQREKNGYLRRVVAIDFRDGGAAVDGLIYIADADNGAWLGAASDEAIAYQISRANGPSGSNRDYVLRLARALRELGADDAHVFAIEHRLLAEKQASSDRSDSAA